MSPARLPFRHSGKRLRNISLRHGRPFVKGFCALANLRWRTGDWRTPRWRTSWPPASRHFPCGAAVGVRGRYDAGRHAPTGAYGYCCDQRREKRVAGFRPDVVNHFSLPASCKRHGHDPWVCLRDVLTRLPAMTPGASDEELLSLLPHRWKPARSFFGPPLPARQTNSPICSAGRLRRSRLVPAERLSFGGAT